MSRHPRSQTAPNTTSKGSTKVAPENDSNQNTEPGCVLAVHGRQFIVQTDDGRMLTCVMRGRDQEIAANDRVSIGITSADGKDGVIEAVLPRRNLFWREDAVRRKVLAANVDRLLYVVGTEPEFSMELVSRAMAAADSQGIEVAVVLTKADLPGLTRARERLAVLDKLQVPVLEVIGKRKSADDQEAVRQALIEQLRPWLSQRSTLLAGQSGMGKSTLVNALVPEAQAATQEISLALSSGRHTTTHARSYRVPNDVAEQARLIDTPGFQQFGISFLDRETLQAAFREIAPMAGQCRFANCRHDDEPGCVVREAAAQGSIHAERYQHYQTLLHELEAAHAYQKRTGRGRR